MSMTRDEKTAAVKKYLDALVSHDGSDVPLAENCWRSEQGKCAAKPAQGILDSYVDPIMDGNLALRDLRFFVDGDNVIAMFLLDLKTGTVHLAERFKVVDGLIHEIEAIFYNTEERNHERFPVDPSQIWTSENTIKQISPIILD